MSHCTLEKLSKMMIYLDKCTCRWGKQMAYLKGQARFHSNMILWQLYYLYDHGRTCRTNTKQW